MITAITTWRCQTMMGVVVAFRLCLLSAGTEAAAFSSVYIGSGGGSTSLASSMAAASSCPLSSRPSKAAVSSSSLVMASRRGSLWRRRRGDDAGRLSGARDVANDYSRSDGRKEVGSPPASSTSGPRASSVSRDGGSEHSGQAIAGNILQRITMASSKRSSSSAAPTTRSATPSTSARLSLLPSDPISRFSGHYEIVGDNKAGSSTKSTSSSSRSSIKRSSRLMPSGSFVASLSPSALLTDVPGTAGALPSSLMRRLSELRPGTFVSSGEHRGPRQQHQRQQQGGRGLQELSDALERVEAKLSLDTKGASELRVSGRGRKERGLGELYL